MERNSPLLVAIIDGLFFFASCFPFNFNVCIQIQKKIKPNIANVVGTMELSDTLKTIA